MTNDQTRDERLAALLHSQPHVEYLRAAVAFDDCCRQIHDFGHTMKSVCQRYDMTPEIEQLEALLIARVQQYVGATWEQDAREAVSTLILAIVRPEDGWTDE